MRNLTLVSYKMIRQRQKKRERESKQTSPAKKSRRAAQNRNDNVA